ncbi:hypothetical protein GQ607_000758 [Colletotrichum asianum]|uniref:Uncharacterized protein n=1 Tax=Colletotrichum asianum TaxID=702518 RepID=A0A8H3WUK1_9PEZI|nr:hypothetical protein GQ607_000758 [Colletotrichum asianum]
MAWKAPNCEKRPDTAQGPRTSDKMQSH